MGQVRRKSSEQLSWGYFAWIDRIHGDISPRGSDNVVSPGEEIHVGEAGTILSNEKRILLIYVFVVSAKVALSESSFKNFDTRQVHIFENPRVQGCAPNPRVLDGFVPSRIAVIYKFFESAALKILRCRLSKI